MTQGPKLSIGLPVYNGENYLASAIESILAQRYTDFELIICDNASTDRTREICQKYVSRDGRVRYFRNEKNLGASANHNRTFELSRGEYFKWAAHDDEADPELLGRCMALIERSPRSVVLVYPEAQLIDCEGRVIGYYRDSIACSDPRPHRRLSCVMQRVGMGTPAYGIVRREALEKTRMLGAFIMADYVFFAELALLGSIEHLDEPLLKKRIHPARYGNANRTKSERLAWFDPRNRKALDFLPPDHRMVWECFRGVQERHLGLIETTLCGFAILGFIVRKERARLGRWKRSAFRLLRLEGEPPPPRIV